MTAVYVLYFKSTYYFNKIKIIPCFLQP